MKAISRIFMLVSMAGVAATIMGCRRPTESASDASAAAPLEQTVSKGDVSVTLTATPGRVFLEQDILLSIRVTTPASTSVTLPSIHDRLLGFMDAGHFDREPHSSGASITQERVIQLTPLIADEYRIAPMAFIYTDKATTPPTAGWLATPPLVFQLEAVTDHAVGNDIKSTLSPIWVYPPLRTVSGYVGILLIILVIGFMGWKLIRRAHRRIRLMRMSPRERAMEELNELLAQKLVEKKQFKDFYVELTMVVRRYIERQHHIRAPEQTTEEFLAAVSKDPRFDSEIVLRLRKFLEAADLVKFAAYQPDSSNVSSSIETATDYITSDADRIEASEGIASITEHKEQLL
jgi:hypothetical protein